MVAGWLRTLVLIAVAAALPFVGVFVVYLSSRKVTMWLRWIVSAALCGLLFGMLGGIRYGYWQFSVLLGFIGGLLAAGASDWQEVRDLFRRR